MNKITANKTALVIAAHPDDEVLGVGGTMARLAKEGWKIQVVIVATGAAGRYADVRSNQGVISTQTKELKKHCKAALSALGIFTEAIFLDFPDNRLDTVSRMDISHKLAPIVQKLRPNTVFTHHPGDYNWDHILVFDAALMACRANYGDFYPDKIYSFEVLSSTERGFQQAGRVFTPNHFVDISRSITAKKKAFAKYITEIRPFPHPRSEKGILALAQKRGIEVGFEYAEAFQLVRSLER